MKKSLLTLVAAVSCFTASAQFRNTSSPTFGIKGGVNFASVTISQNGTSSDYGSGTLTSFSAGVFADLPLGEKFSVQPGLFYSGKGYKIKVNFDMGSAFNINAEESLKLAYIQLPVHFLYNADANFGRFFFGAGPFAAAAIKAKGKISGDISLGEEYGGESGSNTTEQDLEIGSNGVIKRLDYGVTGLIGVRFNNGISLSANYDYGLADIYNNSVSQKMKTRTIGLSLGYSF
ncbi:porin family protein [Mucilaginibacter aquatilis]|uniref:Outer membrane beta-barrel protein n=1 Tax=Mucilaginibacter aquatilis TaxID=1517760 RepID=A0A6I4I6K9_9SPHI|nr:porin family protein [Mucilaginibacter aquatilis]MVN89768.1 outer membrane beta-barrel protein [Mucilaginibacter aquatilis]